MTKLSIQSLAALVGSFLFWGCGGREAAPVAEPNTLYGQTARIIGFDPVATGDLASSRAMQLVYEGLLQYDYTARPYRLIPALAAALPEVSEDGRVYTFHLREGIYFSDDACFPSGVGRELTAQDVIYSIKRLADMNRRSSGFWTVRNKVVGLDAFRAQSEGRVDCYADEVPGLRALDRYTVRIELKEPYPQFLWVLAMHYFSVVPREAVTFYGEDFSSHPVGTAAYQLKAWRRNYRLEYGLNPAWKKHGRVDTVGQPQIERLVDYVISDGTTQWLMFCAGQLDCIGLSVDQFDSVLLKDGSLPAELQAQGVQLHKVSRLDTFYLGFNMDDALVGTHLKLRQAMSCAFDHAAWTRFFQGQVQPMYGPVPRPLRSSRSRAGPYGYNLEKAKRLLAEAGYPGGIDPATGRRLVVTLDSSGADNSQLRQSNELIVHFMDQLGILLEVRYSNRPTFFEKVRRGDVQLFRLSWIADYSDSHNFLQLFYGPNAHGCNRANFRNAAYDALFESFMVLPPSDERAELAEQMVDIVVEQCPWIFMHQPVDYVLTSGRVKNYVPHAFPGGMAKYYAVDKD